MKAVSGLHSETWTKMFDMFSELQSNGYAQTQTYDDFT